MNGGTHTVSSEWIRIGIEREREHLEFMWVLPILQAGGIEKKSFQEWIKNSNSSLFKFWLHE